MSRPAARAAAATCSICQQEKELTSGEKNCENDENCGDKDNMEVVEPSCALCWQLRSASKKEAARPGMNCIKIGLPGKLILSKRKGILEVLFSRKSSPRIDFPGRPIFIQLPPDPFPDVEAEEQPPRPPHRRREKSPDKDDSFTSFMTRTATTGEEKQPRDKEARGLPYMTFT